MFSVTFVHGSDVAVAGSTKTLGRGVLKEKLPWFRANCGGVYVVMLKSTTLVNGAPFMVMFEVPRPIALKVKVISFRDVVVTALAVEDSDHAAVVSPVA